MKKCNSCSKEIEKRNICGACSAKQYRERKRIPKIDKNCLICGALILSKWCTAKFCGAKCKSAYNGKIHREKLRKESPHLYEEYLLKRRNQKRTKKGIDINLPPLLAKRGTGYLNSKGYRRIYKKGHPNSTQNGSSRGNIFEHIFVMSEYLCRPLLKHENVHHKNGLKHDNRIENLELWSRSQPPGQRVEDKIQWCLDFLKDHGKVEWHPNQYMQSRFG